MADNPGWMNKVEDAMMPKDGTPVEATLLDDAHMMRLELRRADVLFVAFEEASEIGNRGSGLLTPFVRKGHSSLVIAAHRRTWFRSDKVAEAFDQMTDEGLFDQFERVVFVGAGKTGGYGAAAYSVAAPGARVLLVEPVATLDRDRTPWERRFRRERNIPFGPRYDYAPDMVDAAQRVTVISDPHDTLASVQASLFHGPHIDHFHAPWAGMPGLTQSLEEMGLLTPMIQAVAEGDLDRATFAKMWRARRAYEPYLAGLMRKLDPVKRPALTARYCRWVLDRFEVDVVRRKLEQAETVLAAREAKLKRA